MNHFIIIFFILLTYTLIGCGKGEKMNNKDCGKHQVWNEESNTCEEKSKEKSEEKPNVKTVSPEEELKETETLYTITNSSSIMIAVHTFNDPSLLSEVNKSDYPTLDTPENWAHRSLESGQCLSVSESQFITSLQIRRTTAGVISCDNFHINSIKKCDDNADQATHLIINDHPTPEGRRYEWITIETTTKNNINNCPSIEKR